jgi:type III pantothenate kinase
MLLVMDIGNTNVVMAVHDGQRWIGNWRIYSDSKKTSDEYFVIVERLLDNAGFSGQDMKHAIICSVVPNLTRAFQKVVRQYTGFEAAMVTHDSCPGIVRSSIPPNWAMTCWPMRSPPGTCFRPSRRDTRFRYRTYLDGRLCDGMLLGAAIAPGLITAVNSLF